MRIIVDVMGGDNAPLELVKGAVAASKKINASFILVGDRDQIEQIAKDEKFDLGRFDIVHTPTVITMEDDPLAVVRAKKDSSMSMGLRLLSEGQGDAFVSTGNTGALFTGATLIVRKIRGIQRAAIGSVLPVGAPCILLDCGANVTVTEDYLEQFAVMGSAYVRKMFHIEAPTVGLLNNGTEEHKGTPLHVETNRRLSGCELINYIGNVEGNSVPFGSCNVVVTDGFTGNVFLKTMEGTAKMLMKALKATFLKNGITKLSALLMKGAISDMKHRFDPSEYGGSPFLGISKPVVKAHGSSDAKAFCNAIRAAVEYAESGVIYDIAEAAEHFTALKKAEREAEAERARRAEAETSGENEKVAERGEK
ncbi:MAG: phosphate acyltransferase PlsX [Clostridia bacterium]|nr:phosphate acyltransferase PlsX [Clostridia bacterium]